MKRYKIISFLLVLILAAAMLPNPAMALETIDTEKPVSLTITYQKSGVTVSDAEFMLYRVADVNIYAQMQLTDEFKGYADRVTGLNKLNNMETQSNWMMLAGTLKNALLPETVPAVTGKTDENGILELSGLKTGLYLVVGDSQTIDSYTYTVTPFMLFLPRCERESKDYWHYDYDLTIAPKASRQSEPRPGLEPITVTRKVLKIWKDNGNKEARPAEITVHLLRSGTVYDTVVLNAENNWRHTWDDLPSTGIWEITEDPVENYTMMIDQTGVTFTVTNTYVPPTPPPSEPPTTPPPSEPPTTPPPSEPPTTPPPSEPPTTPPPSDPPTTPPPSEPPTTPPPSEPPTTPPPSEPPTTPPPSEPPTTPPPTTPPPTTPLTPPPSEPPMEDFEDPDVPLGDYEPPFLPEYDFEDPDVPLGDLEFPEDEIGEPVPPASEVLPQTGMLWWPVPVMLGLGIVLLAIGTVVRRRDEK